MPVSQSRSIATLFVRLHETMHSPLLELVNYRVLGRMLYYVPYFAPIPPARVLSTFGALIALVETLNSLGVAFSSNPSLWSSSSFSPPFSIDVASKPGYTSRLFRRPS